jgi:hypothetical protein
LKKAIKILIKILAFAILTILTQIGGIAFMISELVAKKINRANKLKRILIFIGTYLLLTFLIVPLIAPLLGREKVIHTEKINPANYMTVILNRNYVRPELNKLLKKIDQNLNGTEITINYLDANFPFINKFPLLPHLSHNDGKKLDLSLIYETKNGEISKEQKSNSGYGVYEGPNRSESNQIKKCLDKGYFQYDFPKYLTLGIKNKELVFSARGTKALLNAILKEDNLGKLFIEPHLKERLKLNNNKVRYHGCRAARHDDHIHIQLK